MGYCGTLSCGLPVSALSPHDRVVPSAFGTRTMGVAHSLNSTLSTIPSDARRSASTASWSANQQLPLDPESQAFVTINTHRGFFHYKGLPFGITSCPAIFQLTMDIILQGLEHVASIQDGILITGKDDEEHIMNVNTVLDRWLWLKTSTQQVQVHAEVGNLHGLHHLS